MIRKTYKVIGMHCTSCPLIIESDLEDSGVKTSCNYACGTLNVEYNESLVSDEKIIEVVRASGYELSTYSLDLV